MICLWLWQGALNLSITDAIAGIGVASTVVVGVMAAKGPKRAADLTAAKIEGQISATLESHGKDIDGLKDEQYRQWQEIGRQGKQIQFIEGTMERRTKSRGHSAGTD